MPWYVWPILVALAGAAVAGIASYRRHRSWLRALMAGAEYAIGELAKQGQPSAAEGVGRNIGNAIEKAGPAVKRANDRLHAEVKKTVAAQLGNNTRTLIAEALRKKREIE